MASEGADFESGVTPPIIVSEAEGEARRRRGERGAGSAILLGLVAVGLAALSAIALYMSQ